MTLNDTPTLLIFPTRMVLVNDKNRRLQWAFCKRGAKSETIYFRNREDINIYIPCILSVKVEKQGDDLQRV